MQNITLEIQNITLEIQNITLEIPNTRRRLDSLRSQDAHLNSDTNFQFRNSLSQGTIKYSEQLYEAMDAGMASQSDKPLTEVSVFEVSIFLRSPLGGKRFCRCYLYNAMSV